VPALVLGCLAAAVWASGRNTALFQGLNAAASGLPAALWAMLTVCGSVLGAIALLAPTLKTQPRWLASAFLAAPLACCSAKAASAISTCCARPACSPPTAST
jgi:hypothetical protein